MRITDFRNQKEHDKNIGKPGEHHCELCGRPVNFDKAFWIRLTTSEEVVDVDAKINESEDLGCWPIGPECIKKHPTLRAMSFKKT